MACGVALKRSLDIDLLHSPENSIKRRRTSTPGHCSPYNPSSFPTSSNTSPKANCDDGSSKLGAYQNELHQFIRSPYNPASFPTSSNTSPKATCDDGSLKLGAYQSDLQQYIRAEIKSKRRRRIFPSQGNFAPESPSSSGSDSDHELRMDSSILAEAAEKTFKSKDKTKNQPLFTVKQVQLICERLLKEQAGKLRDEYDQVLKTRMAEQYDTFVRFTYDQIHRNLQANTMSYLS